MNKILKNPFLLGAIAIMGMVAVAVVLFPEFVHGLFRPGHFMPHLHCYLDDPRMIWLHVISDLLIGLAYVSISATLGYLVYRASRNIPFHWMFLAFGVFIISCGFTHFMEVVTVWHALYWLAGYVKVITAVASVVTAIALFPLVPKIFALIHSVKVSEERRLKLIAANQELEAFAYSISHDLRAPLRTMQGMARAMKQDCDAEMSPAAQNFTNKIIGAAERMDDLLLDLLKYSRMNLTEFVLAPVELKVVMEEVRALIEANVQERNAVITCEGNFPRVIGDHALLIQVVSNLLMNALKFVAPGVKPVVIVKAEDRRGRARISFIDNGIGIAPEHQERIFKIFERLHSGNAYPGTGVGLAIVQRAMVRMGGEVGLESEVGKGSCFWIELKTA